MICILGMEARKNMYVLAIIFIIYLLFSGKSSSASFSKDNAKDFSDYLEMDYFTDGEINGR